MRTGSIERDGRARGRCFALVLVVGMLAVCSIVLVSLQSVAFGDAGAARESVARVRAYWAARAGVEASIARAAQDALRGDVGSAYALIDDFEEVSQGNLSGAVWEVAHHFDNFDRLGPQDAGAKLNINTLAQSPTAMDDLMEIEGMSEDVAAAILDWIDADDLIRELGAERNAYQAFASPYEPRNAPMRSIRELELVRNVRAEDVRGEDWNLNGVLDPWEDDGDATWPPDNRNGRLDAGWSRYLTAESVEDGYGSDGRPRLYLLGASEAQVVDRIDGLTPIQARVMLNYALRGDTLITDFIGTSLVQMASDSGDPALQPQAVQPLTREQIGQVLGRCTFYDPEGGPVPGRVNLNTTSREVLALTPIFRGIAGEGAADLLLFARNQRGGGFASMLELLEYVPAGQLQIMARFIDVESHAYVITSRGVDTSTGLEVQIQATIDQRMLPIVITEMIVR